MRDALNEKINFNELTQLEFLTKDKDTQLCVEVLLEVDRFIKSLGPDGRIK